MSRARRVWERWIGSVQVIIWAVVIVAAGVMSPVLPSAAQESSSGQTAGGWCPAGTESLDVLILMDESRSLRRTDPDRKRIEAVETLIGSFEEESARGVRVRVALAAFGTEFDLRKDFTDLRAEGTENLIAEVKGFNQDDWNTDYVLALYGVLGLDWSAECNKVVWYTDGEHDLTDAPRGGSVSRAPRDYDAQGREIENATVGRAVQELLIPAVCGGEEADEVASGYGDLSDKLKEREVEIEFALYYFGELEEGDSKALIESMERKECGDGIEIVTREIDQGKTIVIEPPITTTTITTITPTTTTTTTLPPPPPPVCQGLPEPQWNAGRDIVWSGVLPDGIAPAFVRSVIIRATGDRPRLSTDHPSAVEEEDGAARRLTLDFSEQPLSSYSPADIAVQGEGVDESCLAVVLNPPALEARVVTSPIFPDTPGVEIQVQTDGTSLAEADEEYLTVSIDGGEHLRPDAVDGGRLRLPPQDEVGDHAFEVRLESLYSDPAIASGAFTVSPKPDGPILGLAGSGLEPVADTEFTIPITIDDEGREGEIRLLPADPIVGTDGAAVSVEVLFPDGSPVWSSGDPLPDALTVVLGDSVQTPEDHVLHFDYESDPSDPAGDLQKIPIAVPVDIDHPRNLVLEAFITAALLFLLLLIIWAWLFGINRIAGRIRRPRRMRYSRFRVDEGWALAADLTRDSHRSVKHTPGWLKGGRLRATRKTPLRAWRFPYVDLSMEGSRRFIGMIGGGVVATEISGRSEKLPSESRLHNPIVLVDVSDGPPFEGVVMAPIDSSRDRSRPAEEQLAEHVRRALEQLPRPDQITRDLK